ncbi:MAG: hypothetical protein ACOZE7_21280 [Pseudomonadota bacterium]
MKHDSFFSRIQSWFSQSYHGRYLAFILAEIGRQHPGVVADLLVHACPGISRQMLRNASFEPEYVFRGTSGRRRADLAVFANAEDDEPVALIEIKYRDRLIPESDVKPAQLDDYLAWERAAPGRYCLVLSREVLHLADACTLTWTKAAQLLQRQKGQSDLVAALIEHLREEGLVMQNIDEAALVGFLKRLLCTQRGSGQLAGNLEGPGEFAKLLKNMKLLSLRFNGDFKNARAGAGEKHADEPSNARGAVVDFEVANRFKVSPRRDLLDEETGTADGRLRIGGEAAVFARHSLGNGKTWLRVGYGIYVDVENGTRETKGTAPDCWFFAFASNDAHSGADRIEVSKKLSNFELITTKAEDSAEKLEAIAAELLLKVMAPMATSNSPTCGHPKFPQARRLDYAGSGVMARRAAASLSR